MKNEEYKMRAKADWRKLILSKHQIVHKDETYGRNLTDGPRKDSTKKTRPHSKTVEGSQQGP